MSDDDDLSVTSTDKDFTGLPEELYEVRNSLFLQACENEAAQQIRNTLAALNPDQQQQVLTWQSSRGAHRFTPLIYAAFYGCTESIRALLEHGTNSEEQANVRGNSAKRQTALHYAASDPDLTKRDVTEEMRAACIVELLKHGANPNLQTNKTKYTPLHKACWSGLNLCKQALIDGGADATLRNKYDEVPKGM